MRRFTTRGETPSGGMYVWDISYQDGPHLKSTITIRMDSYGDGVAEVSDSLVSGATVYFTMTHLTSGDYSNYVGTTDSSGQITFMWKRAPSGSYGGLVTDLTHSTYTYNSLLDFDNPDYFTRT